MNMDRIRIKSYLAEIKKNAVELHQLLDHNELQPDSLSLKAAKYMLIEIAEAMSNTVQHIVAKEKGLAVSGYIDTIVKAREHGILSDRLFQRLKPFFDFRNSLIHRYWKIDDQQLIANIHQGRDDFDCFLDEIEAFLEKKT